MRAALGVSHKEVDAAILWLRWASYLGPVPLTVSCTRSVDLDLLRPHAPWADFRHIPDEQERGYPGSASHLFVRTLQGVNRSHPGEAMLWLECDAIPLKRTWLQDIAAEYATCGMPFMGHIEKGHYFPHMAGVGVYPSSWELLAPRILTTLKAPDNPAFPKGSGQAWDTYARRDIVPNAAQSRRIQQVWRWDGDITKIWTTTVLFHQDKTGKLIGELSGHRITTL